MTVKKREGLLLFLLDFGFNLVKLVLHLDKSILAQLNQLSRFADLDERLFKVDLVLIIKPIRDLLDVLEILF